MRPDAFDYDLPASAVAQVPVEPRDAARLLVSLDDAHAVAHRQVSDLAELLGPGDLLRAWDDRDTEVLLPRTVEWTALTHSRLAIIDQALAVRAAQWPEIFAALVERAARRAERLVVMQAIAHLTRVDDRLLALLWCLAERWGRVAPGGVVVSLRLLHRTLAGMVGARRPSVTTALGQLISRGEIERRPDGGWLLLGEPPEAHKRPESSSTAYESHSASA